MTNNLIENQSVTNRLKDPGMIPEGFVYRDQKKRYPW